MMTMICNNDDNGVDFDASVHKQISGPTIGSREQGGGREEIESQWNQVVTRYLSFQQTQFQILRFVATFLARIH